MIRHRTVALGDDAVFLREAGTPGAPVLLLLHGFPSSSHMFRRLLARLDGEPVHCIAPDLPGFGWTEAPPPDGAPWTFDHLADVVERLVDALAVDRATLYLFDYGAPVGLRLALRRPALVEALIVQNGNAYVEGLSDATAPLQAYWRDRAAHEGPMRELLTLEGTRMQYETGVRDPAALAPEAWTLDHCLLDRPDRVEAMLDLLYDYRANVAAYPQWQAWLRAHQPPLLIAWGRNDPFFTVAGAEAYRRDVPGAELHLLDTGHFALEEDDAAIAALIAAFLQRVHAAPARA